MSAPVIYSEAMSFLSLGRHRGLAEAAAQAARAAERNAAPEALAFHQAVLAEVRRRVEQSASRN